MKRNKREYDWSNLHDPEHHKVEIIFYLIKNLISNPISKLIIKYSDISPNQMTVISLFFLVAATPFLASRIYGMQIVGIILVFVYYILDLVDGDIARVKGPITKVGKWMDNLIGYISLPLIVFSIMLSIDTKFAYLVGAWAMISFAFMYQVNASFKLEILEITDNASLANTFKSGFLGYFWGYAWVFLVLFITILAKKPILFLISVALGNLGSVFLLFLQYKKLIKLDKSRK